jgi:sugar-specific transcriptional regulator TrmB
MRMSMIKVKYLESLGLSEKEALVYLELLKSDVVSGIELSRETNLKKPTVYVILECLKKRNLIKEIRVGKRIHYMAESPDVLVEILDKQQDELDQKYKKAKEIIFELKSVERKPGQRPLVKFYEGKEAVKESISEFVSQVGFSPGNDYGIYAYDHAERTFTKSDIAEIDRRRIENNIKFKAIYSGNTKFLPSTENRELIKVAQDRFPLETDISIYGDEVLIHIYAKTVFGISIKNLEFSNTMKSLIEYVFSCKPK